MAQTVSDILIKFRGEGESDVGNAFKRITREARQVEKTFKSLKDGGIVELRLELDKLKAANVNSISSMKAQRNALMGLRDMADVAGNEFKQLTAEIKQMDAALAKAQAKKAGGLRGRFGGIAKGLGSIAAGGIFGGAEGAIGAGIGLKVGGLPGAAVGGAIGAQVKMVRESIAGLAEYSAALNLQRRALRLVIGDTQQYTESQKFLLQTSRDLAIPQEVITRQFTSLTASVVGAGKSVSDAEKVFEAIAAGIRGTGGNLEDMKAAMRATSQVFSKGKVSAEELRQQLGERLPGAFTLFAESMGKTPAELDKSLEQGKVTLDDFMKFADTLFERYGENAKILAKAPEAAGDRLQTQLSELKDAVGKAIIPIGAAFQESFADIGEAIAQNEGALEALKITISTIGSAAFATFASIRFLTRSIIDLAAIAGNLAMLDFKKAMEIMQKGLSDTAAQAKKDFQTIASFFNSDGTPKLESGNTSFSANRRLAMEGGGSGDGGGGGQITKTITEGAKLLQQQERLLDLKAIEDKFEKQILKRKQEAADEAEKINQMTVGEGQKGFDTEEQKATALANVEKLLQQDILKIKGEQKVAEADKALAIGKIKFELGLITKKELENLQISKEAADKYNELKANGELFRLTLDQIKEKLIGVKTETNTFAEAFKKVFDAATDLEKNISNLAVQGIDKLGDAFADFVVTGKASFKELAASILADLGRMITKALFFKALFSSSGLFPDLGKFLGFNDGGGVKKSATGNVFAKNKIVPYAKGGILSNSIVDKPTIFPMAKGGIGLMAEAGYPEAVMPLKRGRDGKLGVISQGGGVNNVTVNVDASGSSVEGDSGQAEQLGAAISQAIQAELLEQKKPGGLLYN